MQAAELCNRQVITASRDMSIPDAARLMRDSHVGSLVVTDTREGKVLPVGILTDRDIVIEIVAKDISLHEVTVGDIMTFALLKVTEDENIFDVAQRMRARGVRRVPVISRKGELIGIIAADDILKLLSEELSLLSRITTRETEQEKTKRS
ncbi:MAG TPA: CBS domain-containing protein [Gammaproteobacteria bacterium]|nr:CBS domain-containing protein [Gammaproteobacteria bacterium]